jgi:hypothetical protein
MPFSVHFDLLRCGNRTHLYLRNQHFKNLLAGLALTGANCWTCATALNCILNAAYFRFSMKLTFFYN